MIDIVTGDECRPWPPLRLLHTMADLHFPDGPFSTFVLAGGCVERRVPPRKCRGAVVANSRARNTGIASCRVGRVTPTACRVATRKCLALCLEHISELPGLSGLWRIPNH
jgi:hypothetical protein